MMRRYFAAKADGWVEGAVGRRAAGSRRRVAAIYDPGRNDLQRIHG